jgi:hypothetical protein
MMAKPPRSRTYVEERQMNQTVAKNYNAYSHQQPLSSHRSNKNEGQNTLMPAILPSHSQHDNIQVRIRGKNNQVETRMGSVTKTLEEVSDAD